MNAEITEMYERLARLSSATTEKAGDGSDWTYTFPDGHAQRYVLTGLKSHAQFDDAARTLLIWIWSAKDYLKHWAQAHGRSRHFVDQAVNADPDLPICADLANLSKHGKLKHSRSGVFPSFGRVSFNVPSKAVRSITIRGNEIQTDIAQPSLVVVSLPVFDLNGNRIRPMRATLSFGAASRSHQRTRAMTQTE